MTNLENILFQKNRQVFSEIEMSIFSKVKSMCLFRLYKILYAIIWFIHGYNNYFKHTRKQCLAQKIK